MWSIYREGFARGWAALALETFLPHLRRVRYKALGIRLDSRCFLRPNARVPDISDL